MKEEPKERSRLEFCNGIRCFSGFVYKDIYLNRNSDRELFKDQKMVRCPDCAENWRRL